MKRTLKRTSLLPTALRSQRYKAKVESRTTDVDTHGFVQGDEVPQIGYIEGLDPEPQYVSDGLESARINTKKHKIESKHGYKPAAIRLPALIAFLVLLGLNIILIERLLATTEKTLPSNYGSEQTNKVRQAGENIVRRDLSSTTSSNSIEILRSSFFYPRQTASSRGFEGPRITARRPQVAIVTTNSTSTSASTSTTEPPVSTSQDTFQSTLALSSSQSTTITLSTSQTVQSITNGSSSAIGTDSISAASEDLAITTTSITSNSTLLTTQVTTLTAIVEYGTSNISTTLVLTSVLPISDSSESSAADQTGSQSTGIANSTTVLASTELGPSSDNNITTTYSASLTGIANLNTTATSEASLTSITPTSTLISTASKTVQPAPSDTNILNLSANEVVVTTPFTHLSYFSALYLGLFMAVLTRAIYEITFSSLRLVEPFERMSRPVGASAPFSVLRLYLSATMSSDTGRSIKNRHFLSLWAAIIYILVEISAPLASATMSVRATELCLVDDIQKRCDPAWVVNRSVIRTLEAIMGICMVCVCLIIHATWNYGLRSIPSNPSSILTLASLLNHQPFLTDLLDTDPDANEAYFNMALQGHHFRMGSHRSAITGRLQYGMTSDKATYGQQQQQMTEINRDDITYMPVSNPVTNHAPRKPSGPSRKPPDHFIDILGVVTSLALLSLLITYVTGYRPDNLNKFFDIKGFVPKLIFIGLTVLVGGIAKHLERIIRITEPYRRLFHGRARPETTILLSLNGTCWSNLPQCLYYTLFKYSCAWDNAMMGWQTTVTVIACLSDLNIVAVAGVLYTDGQIPQAFQACASIAITISFLMVIIVITTVFWWRRIPIIKQMPRRPETVAIVLSYLCGSAMVRDWMMAVRFEGMSEKERDKAVVESGKRFRFARIKCAVDQKMRWCIDFDEMSEQASREAQQLSFVRVA